MLSSGKEQLRKEQTEKKATIAEARELSPSVRQMEAETETTRERERERERRPGRERERERDHQRERERERDIYIYIYAGEALVCPHFCLFESH